MAISEELYELLIEFIETDFNAFSINKILQIINEFQVQTKNELNITNTINSGVLYTPNV